jgi:hypothetical protein
MPKVICKETDCKRYVFTPKHELCGKCALKWYKGEVCYRCKGLKPIGYLFCDDCKREYRNKKV